MPGKNNTNLARHHLFSAFLFREKCLLFIDFFSLQFREKCRLCLFSHSCLPLSGKVSALPTEGISFRTKKTGLTRLFSFGAADRI